MRVAALTVSTQWQDGTVVIGLAGDLDLAAIPSLREHVQTQLGTVGCHMLTLDMSELTFLDSSGIGILVELCNLAKSRGIGFGMVNVPSGQARIITIAGLADTFGLPGEDESDAR
jgi:anti-sigma B factor antagonist